MRLNKELSKHLYTTLDKMKRVSRVSFSEAEISNLCYTINHINGLDVKESMVGTQLLSNYEIPSVFSDMIVPARVKFNSEEYSIDFKSKNYADNAIKGQLLTAHEFDDLWASIMGAFKINSPELSNVLELREDSTIADMDKRLFTADESSLSNSLCVNNDVYYPVEATQNFYKSHMYSNLLIDVFDAWLRKIIRSL